MEGSAAAEERITIDDRPAGEPQIPGRKDDMKLSWAEWSRHKKLLNEFSEHRNTDGERALSLALKIKHAAAIEIPDDIYNELNDFTSGIEFSRKAFESFFPAHGSDDTEMEEKEKMNHELDEKLWQLQQACNRYKETDPLADLVLFSVSRHFTTDRATAAFTRAFIDFPEERFTELIKACLNGDKSDNGIMKTVKRIIREAA